MRGSQTVYNTMMYGGRYTSVNGGVSIAGVAATGGVVNAQIDYYNNELSWYIGGVPVFTNAIIALPQSFFVGITGVTGGQIESASFAVSATTPFQMFCPTPPPSPPPPPSPSPPPPPPPPPPVPAAPPAVEPSVCPAGTTFLLNDYSKNLCLHVLGAMQNGAWAFPVGKTRYVITSQCAGNANPYFFANQGWTWSAPTMTHTASGLVLTVQAPSAAATVNGAGITVSPPTGSTNQQWSWESYGMFVPLMAPRFSMTDSRAVANAPRGMPVHLWQLQASLPTGVPNAAWAEMCVPNV